jgi:hypothetical protein
MNEQQLTLVKQAVKNYPHEFVGVIPFTREITSDNPIEGIDYIPYGSTLFTTLAFQRGWRGLHFDPDVMTYTKPERPEYVFRPSDEYPNEVLT